MEDTGQELELVHVLRHSFRPSQPLSEAIESFIKPGLKLPEEPLFYGTKEAAVEQVKYNDFKYKKEEDEARKAFQAHNRPLYIDPIMHFRQMGSKAVRMAFIPTPESTEAFNEAIDTLDVMPTILRPYSRIPRYFLYIDIPSTHLVQGEEWNARYHDLRKALTSRIRFMYLVRPNDVVGQDGKRHVIPIEERPVEIDPYDIDDSSLSLPL